jgi:hypothetical protein
MREMFHACQYKMEKLMLMVPKCVDMNKLVTACVILCHENSFRAKVDVKGNER